MGCSINRKLTVDGLHLVDSVEGVREGSHGRLVGGRERGSPGLVGGDGVRVLQQEQTASLPVERLQREGEVEKEREVERERERGGERGPHHATGAVAELGPPGRGKVARTTFAAGHTHQSPPPPGQLT